jgi:hypothetical protein
VRETNQWFRQHDPIEGTDIYFTVALTSDGPRDDIYFAIFDDGDDGSLTTCQMTDIRRTHPVRMTCHTDGGEHGRFDGIVDATGYDSMDRTRGLAELLTDPDLRGTTMRPARDRHEATADQLRMVGEMMDNEVTDVSEIIGE